MVEMIEMVEMIPGCMILFIVGPEVVALVCRVALLISCSVCFAYYLQHFGVGSCHFNGFHNSLEFRLPIFIVFA